MQFSDDNKKILVALFNVKKELGSVAKTSNNPFFKSKYADLNSHLDVAEPVLEKFGCFVAQGTRYDIVTAKTVGVTRIIHAESGEWVEGSMELVLAKNDMQNLGAAATYARRFVLSGLLSMKAEDDDGNTASGKIDKRESQGKASAAATSLGFDKEAAVEPAKNSTTTIKPAGSFRRPTTPVTNAAASDNGEL